MRVSWPRNSNDARARMRLGRVLLLLSEPEAGTLQLEASLRTLVDPAHKAIALLSLGDAARSAGRLEDASVLYVQALHQDPQCQSAAVALSHTLRQLGDADDVGEEVSHEVVNGPDDDGDDDDESWRDEVVADIFDRPPSPKSPKPESSYADWLSNWYDRQEALKLEARSRNRRARRFPEPGSSAHVVTEQVRTDPQARYLESSDSKPSGCAPGG